MTGGQGADDEVLGSAEFFDLSTQQWTMVINDHRDIVIMIHN